MKVRHGCVDLRIAERIWIHERFPKAIAKHDPRILGRLLLGTKQRRKEIVSVRQFVLHTYL